MQFGGRGNGWIGSLDGQSCPFIWRDGQDCPSYKVAPTAAKKKRLQCTDGTLAPTRLDIDFPLRHSIRTVSAVVPAGVRLGKGVDFLMQPTPNRQELAARLAPLKQ